MDKIFDFLNKRFYLIMLSAVCLSVVASYFVPFIFLSWIYGISVLLKEMIVILMPILIFCCAYQCMYKLKGQGFYLIIFVLSIIATSNFISAWIGYSVSHIFQFQNTFSDLALDSPKLVAPWSICIPKLIPNEMALMLGIVFGLFGGGVLEHPKAQISSVTRQVSTFMMQKILVPIIPVFMMGFMIKMMIDGSVLVIFKHYTKLTLILVITYMSYLLFGYGCMAGFKVKKLVRFLKNLLPAGWVGFTTMSSLVALPMNLQGCMKNTQNREIVEGVLPISTNIHLVGDSIGIPILAISILLLYFGHMPSFMQYGYFAIMLVLAKFSVAAVPGGGIMVMLPVLQSVFGFNGEMVAMVTMLYILLDPIFTAANILGNGLLVMVIDKLAFRWLSRFICVKY